MRILNTSTRRVTLNFRNGAIYDIEPSAWIERPDSETDYLDDNAATLALFSSGQLVLLATGGGAWAGAPLPALPDNDPAPALLPATYSNQTRQLTPDSADAVRGAVGGVTPGAAFEVIQSRASSGLLSFGDGAYTLAETLLIGSDTVINADPAAVITSQAAYQHTMIRTGNAEFSAVAAPIPGVTIYCADQASTSGTGTLRYTHATTSLAWQAPGAAVFGTEVNISSVVDATTVAILTIPGASAGQAIYVYVCPATRSGVISRTVRVEPVTGARAVAWTRSGNVRGIVEPGHGRKRGDFVALFGAAGGQRHGFISAVTRDTWTIDDPGADASGTGTAYGVRNSKLRLQGAQLDYNKNGQAVTLMSNLHAVIMHGCSDFSVSGLTVANATKYALLYTGAKNFRVRDVLGYRTDSSDHSGNSDVVHPLGPVRSTSVHGVRAQGGDNILGVGSSDYYDYVFHVPSMGDLSLVGGDVRDVTCEDTDEHPVRFYVASGNNWIRNWTVDTIQGTYTAAADACVAIITDAMYGGMVDYGATNIDGLTIISPDAERTDGVVSHAFVNRGPGIRRNISIKKLRPRACNGTVKASVWNTSTIESLSVELDEVTSASGYIVGNTTSSTINRLRISGQRVAFDNALGGGVRGAIVSNDTATSQIDHMTIDLQALDDVSASGNKASVLFNNGVTGRVVVSNVVAGSGTDAVIRNTSTATTTSQHVTLRDVTQSGSFVFAADKAPATLDLVNVNHIGSASSLLLVTDTAGDIRLRATNVRCTNRFIRNSSGNCTYRLSVNGLEINNTALTFVVDAGTPDVRLQGACDMQIDGAVLNATVGNHAAGARFYNSGAGFGAGVGAYVRGSSTWTRVAA
jgi:hypothetical protein